LDIETPAACHGGNLIKVTIQILRDFPTYSDISTAGVVVVTGGFVLTDPRVVGFLSIVDIISALYSYSIISSLPVDIWLPMGFIIMSSGSIIMGRGVVIMGRGGMTIGGGGGIIGGNMADGRGASSEDSPEDPAPLGVVIITIIIHCVAVVSSSDVSSPESPPQPPSPGNQPTSPNPSLLSLLGTDLPSSTLCIPKSVKGVKHTPCFVLR
jgi:hypothetical protein